jgi:hypothetical protein
MSTHKGKPSEPRKGEGKGIPSVADKNVSMDKKLTNEYTDDDKKLAESVRTNNPNRNTDKKNPTNIHGYRG